MARPDIGNVPFDEAISYFRQKQNIPTDTWTDLWEGMHARAFVVAGARDGQLLADFRQSLDKAIADGTTLEDFRQDFDRIVSDHGWSYRGSRGWRSRLIFQVNTRMAYAAGKWQTAQRLKDRRPYLRYTAVLDNRTRDRHADWHGTVLPVDHPFWDTHYPPNGWNCRCSVQQLSERDLERFGYERSDEPNVRQERRSVQTPEGTATVETPEGIDTGFGYNPGKAAWGRAQQETIAARHGAWRPLQGPRGRLPADAGELPAAPARAGLGSAARSRDELRDRLRAAIGGQEATIADPTGTRILVNDGLADALAAAGEGEKARLFPLVRELLDDPQEVWAGFAQFEEEGGRPGQVRLRRRYLRRVALEGGRTVLLAADTEDGHLQALTLAGGDDQAEADRLRSGLRVHRRQAAE